MTAWQFLRWYAANHDPVQRGILAATITVTAITAACWPAMSPSPPHGWIAVLTGAASLLLYVVVAWLAMGSHRIQRWVIGNDPAGPGA